MIEVNESVRIPDAELDWSYARSGGPGGQNVNKVSSKAVLRWAMAASPAVSDDVKSRLRSSFPGRVTAEGDVLISSQEYRDQERNRQACEEKLADMLRKALTRPKPRRATKPSKGSKERRLAEKKRQATRRENRRPAD